MLRPRYWRSNRHAKTQPRRGGSGAKPELCCRGCESQAEVGARLLQAAQDCAADTLLMGAYGSEIRRVLVLGGVTQYVTDHAELPIVMAR